MFQNCVLPSPTMRSIRVQRLHVAFFKVVFTSYVGSGGHKSRNSTEVLRPVSFGVQYIRNSLTCFSAPLYAPLDRFVEQAQAKSFMFSLRSMSKPNFQGLFSL